MTPRLKYKKSFLMNNGTKPDLTVGEAYEVVCAFYEKEDELCISIIDDIEDVHNFLTSEDWFYEHFDIIGDISTVLEEI